jgi:hypothetical protein
MFNLKFHMNGIPSLFEVEHCHQRPWRTCHSKSGLRMPQWRCVSLLRRKQSTHWFMTTLAPPFFRDGTIMDFGTTWPQVCFSKLCVSRLRAAVASGIVVNVLTIVRFRTRRRRVSQSSRRGDSKPCLCQQCRERSYQSRQY